LTKDVLLLGVFLKEASFLTFQLDEFRE
jgi:hypothetical protein